MIRADTTRWNASGDSVSRHVRMLAWHTRVPPALQSPTVEADEEVRDGRRRFDQDGVPKPGQDLEARPADALVEEPCHAPVGSDESHAPTSLALAVAAFADGEVRADSELGKIAESYCRM
jgi:hypothetical protein